MDKELLEQITKEVNEVLEKHKCGMVAVPQIAQNGTITASIHVAPLKEEKKEEK